MLEETTNKYDIRVGVEEEVFIVNDLGFLSMHSDSVMKNLVSMLENESDILDRAKKYLFGFQWEPHPSQVEYVTRPYSLLEIKKAIHFGREILAKGAKLLNHKIYIGSLHPVQSKPNPMCGTHISISVNRKNGKKAKIKELQYIFNHIRNHLPEIIALTANSPICEGEYTGFASSRLFYSKVLSDSSLAVIKRGSIFPVPHNKRRISRYTIIFSKFHKSSLRLIANPKGERLLDITPRGPLTNIVEDLSKKRNESRIEIRVIDNQPDIKYLADIIKIISGLALEALDNLAKGHKLKERENLRKLKYSAIRDGINARVSIDSKTIILRDATKEMIDKAIQYLEPIGIKLETALKEAKSASELYSIPRIENPSEKLGLYIKKGKTYLEILTHESKILKTISGIPVLVPENTKLFGKLFADFKLEWIESPQGIIRSFKKIKKNYWLATRDGYIRLSNNDKILKARNIVNQLVCIFESIKDKKLKRTEPLVTKIWKV